MSTEEPMSIEDRVRTATRAGATLVRDIGPLAAPDRVRLRAAPRRRPPLAFLGDPARRRGGRGAGRAEPGRRPPLQRLGPRRRRARRHCRRRCPATTPRSTRRELPARAAPGRLIVGDDVTGTDDRHRHPAGRHRNSFRAGRQPMTGRSSSWPAPRPRQCQTETWYLLRIAPGAAPAYRLSKLAIKLPGSAPSGLAFALSPDDSELAIESLSKAPAQRHHAGDLLGFLRCEAPCLDHDRTDRARPGR